MKPYAAVQPIFRKIPNEDKGEFAGSSFRLWADNHFLTAGHCVQDYIPENVGVFDKLQNKIFHCVNITRQPTADLAVLEIEGQLHPFYQKFKIAKVACTLGENVRCFGALRDWRYWNPDESTGEAQARLVGGLVQRFFTHESQQYVSPAFEFSTPIPQGMSGGPAFNAKLDDIAVGVAIGTIKSSVFVSETVHEYEENGLKERERIEEVIRYGVVLRLFDFTDWLKEVLPA